MLARRSNWQDYPVVDTAALNDSAYNRFLHRHYPNIWPEIAAANDNTGISLMRLLQTLDQVSKTTPLYYLNPSFGFYFEQFYQEPHGLNYAMKELPGDTLLPPNLDTNLIQENESFWTKVLDESLPAIERGIHPTDLRWQPGVAGWLMTRLHITTEQDPNSVLAAAIYSRSLNFLGVRFQRAGELDKATALFTNAIELNSNNVVASINLEFNKSLRAGSPAGVNLSHVPTDLFGQYRNWNEVLDANGPFDETSFCFEDGANLVQAGLMRQATSQFNRVRQLATNNLPTRLFLGRIYTLSRLPDRALEALEDPMTHPSRFGLTDYNSTEMDLLAATAYFQKNEDAKAVPLLEAEMERHPDDDQLLLFSAQIFNMHHLYTNALDTINRKLARSPDDPSWVYGKGYVCLQIGDYDDAVKALTHFLELQTNSPDATFYRGVAQMQAGRLDAARADFLRLQGAYQNNLQVAYNLGDIAWREHQTNEVIRNYQIVVANAPTNAVELKIIKDRLAQLGSN
jgi:tetratricopeptide (TPR) repeat protein